MTLARASNRYFMIRHAFTVVGVSRLYVSELRFACRDKGNKDGFLFGNPKFTQIESIIFRAFNGKPVHQIFKTSGT